MRYELVLTNRSLKALKKLDKAIKEEILKALDEITENPLGHKALRYELKGYYSARVGKLRIIYKIEGNNVIVLSIEHRKKVYRGID